jgi:hypothetical protein
VLTGLAGAALAQVGGSTDRLLVGSMTSLAYSSLTSVPLPTARDEKFCTLVRLAPDVLAWAYVPTPEERAGQFPQFDGLLVDPQVSATVPLPFPGGVIPRNRIPGVFAWRLAAIGPAPGENCRPAPPSLPMFASSYYVTGLDARLDQLVLSQSTYSFDYVLGQSAPDAQMLRVSSTNRPLAFDVSDPRDRFSLEPIEWLSVERPRGCCVGNATILLRFRPGLSRGIQEAVVDVTPISAIGPSQRVHVQSTVNAPPNYVVVDNTLPDPVQYTAGSNTVPGPVTIEIQSLGAARSFLVQVEVITPQPTSRWLRVSPMAGNVATDLTVTFDLEQLRTFGRGTYLALIRIFAPGAPNSPVTIAMRMSVVPPPDFTYTPNELVFTYTPGAIAPSLDLGLDTPSAIVRQLDFNIWATSQNPPGGNWLQVTPSTTKIPKTLTVSLNAAAASALAADTYTGFINVSAGTATGAEVPVRLVVNPATGDVTTTQVLAHIADGARWKTTIILMNTDPNADAPVTLRFWPGERTPAGTPLTFEDRPPLVDNTLAVTVPRQGSVTLRTTGSTSPPLWQGWAEVTGPLSVGGTAIFRAEYDAAQNAEGAVPLKPPAGRRFLLYFDNTPVADTRGYDTGFAIVNTSATQTANVSVTIREQNGQVRLPAPPPIRLAPREHRAFPLVAQFGTTAGIRGVAEFVSDGADIAGLGLRFNPSGVFTSFEALTEPGSAGTQRLAHIADGQSWRTSIILVNPGNAASVTGTLRFYPGKGTPNSLDLPLEGGATASGGSLTITLERGASATINTRGDTAGQLWQGWAELSATAPMTGFAVFRAQPAARQEIEGAVPLVGYAGSQFFMPVEHDSPAMVTSLALVSIAGGNVTATLRDAAGNQVLAPNFDVFGHTALDLTEPPFGVADASGVLQFTAPGAQIFGLGLRFNNARNAFTSLPVLIR